MKEIVFVTSNPNKAREVKEILGVNIETKHLELDELQSMDLDVIIRHKLEQAWQALNVPVIVDDAGVYAAAWEGFPGPLSKFIEQTMGLAMFVDALGSQNKATWKVAVGYRDGERTLIGRGAVEGRLVPSRGDGGFGYDPFFQPDGKERTYAEMTPEEKHKISARAQALQDLKRQLT